MLMHRPQTPQPGFGSITLLQKFNPRFKILDPRLPFYCYSNQYVDWFRAWILEEKLFNIFIADEFFFCFSLETEVNLLV